MNEECEFPPLTESDIKDVIEDLKKAIKEDKKVIKFYEAHEGKHPHLTAAKKVSEEAIREYEEEIKEWEEELKRREEDG